MSIEVLLQTEVLAILDKDVLHALEAVTMMPRVHQGP